MVIKSRSALSIALQKKGVRLIKKTTISSFHVVLPVNVMTKKHIRTMNECVNCGERKLNKREYLYHCNGVFHCFLQCIIV